MNALTKDVAAPAATAPAIALRDVRKVHGEGDGAVVALDGISIELAHGSFTAIMGPSGSGKSTFLHVAAGPAPPPPPRAPPGAPPPAHPPPPPPPPPPRARPPRPPPPP